MTTNATIVDVRQLTGDQQRLHVRKAIHALRHGGYNRLQQRDLRARVRGYYVGREWVTTPYGDDQIFWNAIGVLTDVARQSGHDVDVRQGNDPDTWLWADEYILAAFYGLTSNAINLIQERDRVENWDFEMMAYYLEWCLRHQSGSPYRFFYDYEFSALFRFAD